MSLLNQVSGPSKQVDPAGKNQGEESPLYFPCFLSETVLPVPKISLPFKSKCVSFTTSGDRPLYSLYSDSRATNSSLPIFPAVPRQGKSQPNVGLLTVDEKGRMVSLNRRFVELWCLPKHLIMARDDKEALEFVSKQFEDSESFLKEIREIYEHPYFVIHDTIIRKNGKILERYSEPLFVDKKIVGRVWEFYEVVEFK